MVKRSVNNVSTNDLKTLRECPFCGGEAAYSEYFGFDGEMWHYAYVCADCGATPGLLIGIGGDYVSPYRTKKEAIEAWNTRHERTCYARKHYSTRLGEISEMVTRCLDCSNCGYALTTTDEQPMTWNYCPNCGARVRSEA